jgi:hypothetical protein
LEPHPGIVIFFLGNLATLAFVGWFIGLPLAARRTSRLYGARHDGSADGITSQAIAFVDRAQRCSFSFFLLGTKERKKKNQKERKKRRPLFLIGPRPAATGVPAGGRDDGATRYVARPSRPLLSAGRPNLIA